MRYFVSVLVFLPLFICGQSEYNSSTRLTICFGSDSVHNKYINLSRPQIYWDTLLTFGEPIHRKRIEIEDFEFISPRKIFNKSENLRKDERSVNGFCAPNAFLFKSNNNVAVLNDSKVYSTNYTKTVNGFGYDYYLKKTEVSNAEYRKFVHYVRDSIALELLAKVDPDKFKILNPDGTYRLNWDIKWRKIWEDEMYTEVLSQMYFGDEDERFYKRKQLNSALFYYKYENDHGKLDSIHIYPDTLKWVEDVAYAWNEPMTQMYFWHPVYDNYPVVGVSYNQAIAYLHWLKRRGVKKLNKKGVRYEISLPKPEEIEYAVASLGMETDNNTESSNYSLFNFYRDKNITFDLILNDNDRWQNMYYSGDSTATIEYQKNQTISALLNPYTTNFGSFVQDGGLHTQSGDLSEHPHKKLHSVSDKVYHLNGNVSEFLDARYVDYKSFIGLKTAALVKSSYPAVAELGRELNKRVEKFKNNYRLVMGGNWLDESYEMTFGIALKGIFSKTFVHADSAHSTAGFRYVIRIINNTVVAKPNSEDFGLQTINIFNELKREGFKLVTDTTNVKLQHLQKMVFYNPAIDSLVKERARQISTSVLDGVYIREYSPRNRDPSIRIFSKYYPALLKTIEDLGAESFSFLSQLPNVPDNMVMKYGLKFTNEYTVELIRY